MLVGGLLTGCAASPPPRPAILSSTELLAWVPGGADWVLLLRPQQLHRSPDAIRMAWTIFGQARVEAWLSSGALDSEGRAVVPALPVLAVASYPDGLLLLAPRQSGELPFRSDGPDGPDGRGASVRGGRFVVAVRAAGRPRAFDLVAAALQTDDATRQPAHAVPDLLALSGGTDDPVVLMLPNPLGLPLGSDVGVLLARQRAMRLGIAEPRAGQVTVRLVLLGEFPPGAEDNLRRLSAVLAQDSLGQAFGGPRALSDLRVIRRDAEIALELELPTESFERGIVMLFGDARAILRGPT